MSIELHPCLQRSKTGKGSQLRLKVNFLPEIIQLSKEVRNLKSLGFRVPLAIVNKAHQVSERERRERNLLGSWEGSLKCMWGQPIWANHVPYTICNDDAGL